MLFLHTHTHVSPPRTVAEWTNSLIWGDNKYILASLIAGDPAIGLEPLAGKVDLIYIDPPFASGQDFSYQVRVGDETWRKEANLLEEKAYRDTWGKGMESYLAMMHERLTLARDLLSPTGSIYLHCDHRVSHYTRTLMEDLFGVEQFKNEIAWCYTGPSNVMSWFPRKHDVILFYGASDKTQFNADAVRIPYKELASGGQGGGQIFAEGHNEERMEELRRIGKIPESWWVDIIPLVRRNNERLNYPTQKPEALLERVIKASSNEGDLVLDFFAGSGTTPAVAEKLGRRWIGCDLSRYAIQVTRKRMLDIEGCRPFQLLNLGRYERRHWQVNVLNGDKPPERAAAEYYRFIVALYQAEAVGGHRHLHGRKAGRYVHVGPADAPVTRDETMDAVRECAANRIGGLDILGWEWELGLHDTIIGEARAEGVDVRLLVIPREVMDRRAGEKGDVQFHELAYLKTSLETSGMHVVVRLDDFIIPNPELVPDEVRSRIKKWSDYIDFWAVDWNYGAAGEGDVFHNEWQTYRTRSAPALILLSEPHVYDAPGTRRILVKVIDIFGNDATQLREVELR